MEFSGVLLGFWSEGGEAGMARGARFEGGGEGIMDHGSRIGDFQLLDSI